MTTDLRLQNCKPQKPRCSTNKSRLRVARVVASSRYHSCAQEASRESFLLCKRRGEDEQLSSKSRRRRSDGGVRQVHVHGGCHRFGLHVSLRARAAMIRSCGAFFLLVALHRPPPAEPPITLAITDLTCAANLSLLHIQQIRDDHRGWVGRQTGGNQDAVPDRAQGSQSWSDADRHRWQQRMVRA